ncbi:VanZ family protein [Hydrogenophaga sp.]|uniref:VanZ family protein n=1 Tax=Hydrogenophaga sp. TaxID=1904254 RepID=UPI003D114C4A
MNPAALHRFAWVAVLLAAAYALALWEPVRDGYRDVDKLAHGLVFAGVYAALAWALRWRPSALVALAWALGAAVEVHQLFLPGYSASLNDWLADALGIGLACGAHLAWRDWYVPRKTRTPDIRLPLLALTPPDMAHQAPEDPFFSPLQKGKAPCARRYSS